jgi:hypothetical protein
MRKALGSLFALIISAFIISTIVSFFMREGFDNLPVKSSSTPVKLTRRMQETTFTVSTEYVSRYDYNWLAEKLQILKDRAGRRILPVPVNFYVGNNLTHAEYPFAGLDMVDGDCNLRTEKIAATRQYFKSLQVSSGENKKVGLHLASFRAIPEGVTLHYTDTAPRVSKCLAAQLVALGEISFLQDSVSLVLPAYQALRVNLSQGERKQLIENAGRNIAAAISEAYKKNPAHQVRVILTNAIPYAAAQSLPFSELAGQFVGLTPDELASIKAAALAAGGAPELDKRIEFGLDTSVVWQLWQTPKVPYFKDASGEPLLYEDMVLSLRRSLADVDAAGVIQNRKLKAIYASYARDNDEKKKWGESINLPYQRSSGERLMKLQVQMLLDIYDFSAVGLETETYVALEMPSRQKFPLLHATVRPLARKLGFEEKKDGSDISEIENSLLLMRTAMAQAGK